MEWMDGGDGLGHRLWIFPLSAYRSERILVDGFEATVLLSDKFFCSTIGVGGGR